MRAESEPSQGRTQRLKSSNRLDLTRVRKEYGLLVSGRDTSRASLRYTHHSDEYHPIVDGKGGECARRS
jgi:mannose-6-phosphate isomerase-like protein (cupin superfamily)